MQKKNIRSAGIKASIYMCVCVCCLYQAELPWPMGPIENDFAFFYPSNM